jgi:hypothetical protein
MQILLLQLSLQTMVEDIAYGAHLPAALIAADFLPPVQESSPIQL